MDGDLLLSSEVPCGGQQEASGEREGHTDSNPHQIRAFSRHTHNFVELIYMCSGSTTHKINGDLITLREGETALPESECYSGDLSGGRERHCSPILSSCRLFLTMR